MNYYERIQKAIDFIELNLTDSIALEEVARQAYMSLGTLYRLFFALTGRTVKEYIRNRRLSCAADDIVAGKLILDVALNYGFDSHAAFTRAFKRTAGFVPSTAKTGQLSYKFERVNVLDKYFAVQDLQLMERYPEIKVLKQIPPLRVAYYCFYGRNPENESAGSSFSTSTILPMVRGLS